MAREAREERRTGWERRKAGRRAAKDRRTLAARRQGRRRRETPTPFTAEEMVELRSRFAARGPIECPACGGAFTLGPARRRGDRSARRVVCLGCGRAAVVPKSHAARILIIEEHAGARGALHLALASAGHEVIEAADAGVGLLAFERAPADVVFLDVLAPGRMDAPEFLRRLRRLFPEARVVAVAGRPSYTGVDHLAVAQGLGAVRALRMPVTREQLLKIVDEVRA